MGDLAEAYKEGRRYQREAVELRRRAAAGVRSDKPDPLKVVAAQTRFRNEEATATDEDMNCYYSSTPSARRP